MKRKRKKPKGPTGQIKQVDATDPLRGYEVVCVRGITPEANRRFIAHSRTDLPVALDTLDLADRIAEWAAKQPCEGPEEREELYTFSEAVIEVPVDCGTCGPCLARRWVKERGE